MKRRGSSIRSHCAAHIWCWPTPVVQIDVAVGEQVAQPLEHVLRLEVAAAAVAERVLVAPLLDLLEPRAVRERRPRSRSSASAVVSCGQHLRAARRRSGCRRAVLRDLGRVDVAVDHARAGRERVELAGHAVVEARADRDQQVGAGAAPSSRTSSRACRASAATAGASRGTRPWPSASSRPGRAPPRRARAARACASALTMPPPT